MYIDMKPSSRQFLHPVLLAAALLAWTAPSQARVVRIVIEKRESPAYDGRSFGSVGRYE
jgi:hypothetical protein